MTEPQRVGERKGVADTQSDADLPELTPSELQRYARHLNLAGVGPTGQRKLKAASVLVIGAGGLGAPVLQYLGAAGVGSITIMDDDVVEESNLQRQVIHTESSAGMSKVDSAARAVRALNSNVSVTTVNSFLNPTNAAELFSSHDLVLDGSDNFATRYLSSDAAEITGTPLVWGTIAQFAGQLAVFWSGKGPMLRDIYPDIPDPDSVPSCAAGGVLGALPGLVGSFMAMEGLKIITGVGEPAVGKMVLIDALTTSTRTLRVSRDPGRPAVTELSEELIDACRGAAPVPSISPEDFSRIFSDANRAPVLIDVRGDEERDEVGVIAGSHQILLADIKEQGWAAVERAAAAGGFDASAAADGAPLVVHCHAGVRSADAVRRLLAERPDANVRSLSGGIAAWQVTGRDEAENG